MSGASGTSQSAAAAVTGPSSSTQGDPSLHYHLMGVGGIGMSAFARLLQARGYQVSGCDETASDLTRQLEREGISVALGHDAAHMADVDVLVASEAVPKSHPELVAAREAGVQVRPRMGLLDELLRAGPSVGVIGTHGKTTTTSMIAVALQGAGLDPSAFVGGIVPEFASNARIGSGPFVAEVDESDRAFAELGCETAVFTNAEDDHVGGNQATYWETVEEQHAGFARFVSQSDRVLFCADWPGLETLCEGAAERLTYGQAEGADYRAVNLHPDAEGTSFTVHWRGEELGQARVGLPGVHNVLNALAALAVAHLYGGNFTQAAGALASFGGPGRRWQRIGELNGALIIDDYAHNATKVAAAVQAARQTGRRVRVVFQPHRYLRTQQSWPRLADALMDADEVLLLDIAAASEAPIEGIHATLISTRMTEQGHTGVHYLPDRADVLQLLRDTAAPGDIIVTMGAGDVWKLSRELAGVAL
ncbi:putative UDP-N-acetylmuramate--L-alanine ligase (UDP-N- acetylmuramoyl-L-alanine synthetase) [Deinococcus deserti VCD115]|uniref:UDP-N-acetylmuramate--L-alanine ligase n=2 Tax=Deinococcus TaxID=1298 RepID=C1CW41_DEIDV|nr:putative UDP-N-acetylmuramate--L-alanine ligase (UDP-N- acetylmuramoyl-L-alanine synthetase) [Deinococcus deserti VCD115]